MQPLRKISTRTVFGAKGDLLELIMKNKEDRHAVMRVVGRATDTKKGKGRRVDDDDIAATSETRADAKDAPWKGLVGEFIATNLQTGEQFYSGVAFFPEFALDMVAGKLGGDIDNVEFGVDIYARYDETSATAYVYEVDFLSDMAQDDRMLALAAKYETKKPVAQIANAGAEKESAE